MSALCGLIWVRRQNGGHLMWVARVRTELHNILNHILSIVLCILPLTICYGTVVSDYELLKEQQTPLTDSFETSPVRNMLVVNSGQKFNTYAFQMMVNILKKKHLFTYWQRLGFGRSMVCTHPYTKYEAKANSLLA